MASGLKGTVALVTGASSGIGEATARELAARGAAGHTRRPSSGSAHGAGSADHRGRRNGAVVVADLTEQDQAREAVDQTVWAWGAVPHLLQAAQDKPREVADLINVSSLSGRTVRKGSAVYNATKHAMNAYSESLRQEVAGRRVRVSTVEPAAVATELFPPEIRRRHRRSTAATSGSGPRMWPMPSATSSPALAMSR